MCSMVHKHEIIQQANRDIPVAARGPESFRSHCVTLQVLDRPVTAEPLGTQGT